MGNVISAFWKGVTYKGGPGHYAFILHRLTGIGVALFLVLHILDNFVIMFGEEAFTEVLHLYSNPVMRLLEVFLIFSVIYHAFNGLRVIIVDFWAPGSHVQRTLWVLVWVVVLPLSLIAAWFTLAPIFGLR
ncbi:MAG TPA: succinate dehydrogenase, cytochrome b556 subunit [Anaerolineae bacterium]|nr:succinate dehydrogenase, cytochrome b556 subunit [Anaerolineae bacterium]